MGSRLREHTRQPGSLEQTTKHLWLPEAHRLVQRSTVLGSLTKDIQRDWLNSLDPYRSLAGRRVEPDRRNWGLKGVACLLKTGRECVATAKVFWDLIAQLEKSGYRAGENLYGVPFDWRYTAEQNNFCADMARTLHTVTNRSTYRKAYVVAHSLGNLQFLYCLQRVFGLETTSKVKALISIAAPWAGSPKVARVLFSGDEMVSRQIISDQDIRDFSRSECTRFLLVSLSPCLLVSFSHACMHWFTDSLTHSHIPRSALPTIELASAYALMPDERVWGNHSAVMVRAAAAQRAL